MGQLLQRIERLERQAARRGRRHDWRGALCLLALMLAAVPLRPLVAQGQTQQGGLPALERRVAALEAANTALQAALTAETAARQAADTALQALVSSETTAREAGDAAVQALVSSETAARAAGDAALQNQVTPLSSLFLAPNPVNGQPFFQRNGTNILITGANLHLRNGLGATNGNPSSPAALLFQDTAVNGLGNLTIGYNEARGLLGTDDRTGSHNLVVGLGQNYSRFGGIASGWFNTVSGPYASVTGGAFNSASGQLASVSGGVHNVASGEVASVGGGRDIEQPNGEGWSAGGAGGAGTFHSP